jgi:hypothetical protein
MGRPAATREYLTRLVDWAGGQAQFCALTGILQPNLSAYLSGAKNISWKRLQSATNHVFGTPPAFVKVLEGHDYSKDGRPSTQQLPRGPGVYAFFDSAMRVIYWGRARDLYAEVGQTLGRRLAKGRPWAGVGARRVPLNQVTKYISAYTISRSDDDFRHDVEALVLRILRNNTYNSNRGHFRRVS